MYNIFCLNFKGAPKIFFYKGGGRGVLRYTINNFKKCFVYIRPSLPIDLSQICHSDTFRHGFALFASFTFIPCVLAHSVFMSNRRFVTRLHCAIEYFDFTARRPRRALNSSVVFTFVFRAYPILWRIETGGFTSDM